MIGDLEKMGWLFSKSCDVKLSDEEQQRFFDLSEQLTETMRRVVGEYANMFSALVETLGAVDCSQHKPLQARIADIVTHHRDPAPFTGPQVTPAELLNIAARMSALGEPQQAARLRRLADEMAYRIHHPARWIGIDLAKADGENTVNLTSGTFLSLRDLTWLKPDAVSGIKDHMSERYGLESIEDRPLWAKLFEIATGFSIEEQQVVVGESAGGDE